MQMQLFLQKVICGKQTASKLKIKITALFSQSKPK